jgi:hypothetical protein
MASGYNASIVVVSIAGGSVDGFAAFISTTVYTSPPIFVNVRGFVNKVYNSQLVPGHLTLTAAADGSGQSLPPVIHYSSYTNLTAENNTVSLFWLPLPMHISAMMEFSCVDFSLTRHLVNCQVCVRTSWTTIGWIIALGTLQSAFIIDRMAKCCFHRSNRTYRLDRSQSDSDLADRLLPAASTDCREANLTSVNPPTVPALPE